jgi:hypothetical protein
MSRCCSTRFSFCALRLSADDSNARHVFRRDDA